MTYRHQDSTSPAFKAAAVTPHDTNAIETTRSLYVGGTGNLNVVMDGDTAATLFVGAPVGYHPLQVIQVLSTGTTATSIVALY